MEVPAFVKSLPRLLITFAEMKALPEYSATLPTGVTPGKRWRRHDGAHDLAYIRRGGVPFWVIGSYEAIPGNTTKCAVVWYRPVIRARALSSRSFVLPAAGCYCEVSNSLPAECRSAGECLMERAERKGGQS